MVSEAGSLQKSNDFIRNISRQDTDTFQVNSASSSPNSTQSIDPQIYILLVKFKSKPSDINKPYLQLHFAIEFSFSTSKVSHGQIYGSLDGLDDSRRPAQEV